MLFIICEQLSSVIYGLTMLNGELKSAPKVSSKIKIILTNKRKKVGVKQLNYFSPAMHFI